MNSTTENVVEMTEESKVKFRLFNTIEYKWHTFNVGDLQAEFYIRPMTHSERARFRNAESELRKSKDAKGAIERAGVNSEDLLLGVDDLTEDQKKERAKVYEKVMDNLVTDLDAEESFIEEVKRVVLACVSKMRIGSEESAFTGELFDAMKSDDLRFWLVTTIDSASNLEPSERAGL